MSFDEEDLMPDVDILPLEVDDAIVALIRDDRVQIPPVPAVALEIQQLNNSGASMKELAAVVAREQSLSAAVLRIANSAQFGAGREVTAIPSALARVGTKELVTLAFTSALAGDVGKGGALFEVRRALWQRGLAASVLCRDIATETGIVDAATAQMCGLLYDFGRIFAVGAVETVLAEHDHAHALVLDDWLKVIERYHAELGIVVAARWNLPSPVAEAISCTDNPEAAGDHAPVVSMVRNVSNIVDSLFRSPNIPPNLLDRLVTSNAGTVDGCEAAIAKLPPKLAALVEAAKLSTPKGQAASLVQAAAVDMPVVVGQPIAMATIKQSSTPHPVVDMRPDGFSILSPEPFDENYVTEAQFVVRGESPISLYTTVAGCQTKGDDSNVVDLQLFCASAAQKRHFRAAVLAAEGRAADEVQVV